MAGIEVKADYKICNHPELYPTRWEQKKPEPAYMIGCIHNHCCPVCGFGQGMHSHNPNCPDKLTNPQATKEEEKP